MPVEISAKLACSVTSLKSLTSESKSESGCQLGGEEVYNTWKLQRGLNIGSIAVFDWIDHYSRWAALQRQDRKWAGARSIESVAGFVMPWGCLFSEIVSCVGLCSRQIRIDWYRYNAAKRMIGCQWIMVNHRTFKSFSTFSSMPPRIFTTLTPSPIGVWRNDWSWPFSDLVWGSSENRGFRTCWGLSHPFNGVDWRTQIQVLN